MIGYDDNITIEKVKTGFGLIKVSGKYTSLKMEMESPANYKLPGNLTIVEEFKEKEVLHLRAKAGNGTSSKIDIDGYDVTISID